MIGVTVIFSWLTSKTKLCRNFHFSTKIFERDVEEISDGRFLYSQHTYGGWLQAEKR
jgi:hypothetical protein